jgi:hypothetical protein
MIVIKEKGVIYFASPMKLQNYFSQAKLDYTFEENSDIFHIADGKGTIVMVGAKNNRVVDLLRYSNVFDCEFSQAGMNQIIANVKELVRGTNCYTEGGSMGLTLCIARGDRCYKICPHGAVFEIEEVACIDESEERMLAAYEHCRKIEDIPTRVETIYRKISELSWGQYFPIALISTRDDSYTLLTGEREKQG